MKVMAQRVTKKSDNQTWCRPPSGYFRDEAVMIDSNDYYEVDTVEGDLPECDLQFSQGAPWRHYYKVGNKILKRKQW